MVKSDEVDPRSILVRNINYLLEKNDWTARELERRSGVSISHISRILSKHSNFTIDVVVRLSKPFGLSYYQILDPELKLKLKKINDFLIFIEKLVLYREQCILGY